MTDAQADSTTGILGIVFSASYVAYAQTIEDSMLADGVGVGGVPTGVGLLMMLASAGLAVKANRARVVAGPAAKADESAAPGTHESPWRPHLLALGLLATLLAYVLVLPYAGYWLSVMLLIGGVSSLAGARDRKMVAACALLGSTMLYTLFTLLLNVRMPAGLWLAWIGN